MTRSQKQFVSWLSKNHPAMMEQVKNRIETAQMGAAADPTEKPVSLWSSIIGGIKDLGPAYLQFKNQKKVLDMQLKRAQQGLAPLNVEQLAPTVRVQAGLSPALQKMILPGALLLGGLVFFMTQRKR